VGSDASQPTAAFSTQCKTDLKQRLRQPFRAPAPRENKRRHALAKDATDAVPIPADEPPSVEPQDKWDATAGEIVHGADVPAMVSAGSTLIGEGRL
jgi:hypothetical protein